MTQTATTIKTEGSVKGLIILSWTLQALCAAAFLAAGGAKLAGAPAMVEVFAKVGVGQWFRYVTGLLEVGSAIGLLIPRLTFPAAILLVAVMGGAVAAHFAVLGGSPAPAFFLLLLTAVIAYLRRPR
jgi:uncharacterized membrane protein YphA (DoxX/SURF4 family)